MAATHTVSSRADSGRGTLRETVMRASSGDKIVIDPAVSTIVLTSGEIAIKTNLVIQGNAANVFSINANASSRIFRISNGVKVTLVDMTLERGRSSDRGGAIFNEGSLLLRRMSLIRNSAMHGGAVYSTGSLKVEASTIYFNQAEYGGGISVGATADLAEFTNTTVSRNTATSDDGGGLTARSRILLINHCTIVQNDAAASYAAGGLQSLAGSSFVSNSIIADNHSLQFNDVFGTINSLGVNIVGDPNGNIGQWDVTDQFAVSPSLGPLQYNNGGTTPTYAPLPGSPVIDAGDESNTIAADQNGAVRMRGATVDIGSVELQPTVQTITVQNSNDSGPGSFREAVASSQPGDIISFATNQVMLSSQLTINKDLVISGPGPNLLSIYPAPGSGSIIEIAAGNRVRISGSKFINLPIRNRGDLFLTNIQSDEDPAHSYAFWPTLDSNVGSTILNNCLITDSHRGGVYVQGGKLIMNNSSVLRNFAVWNGGGIYFNGSVGRIRNSTIAQNQAGFTQALNGGGIYVASGYLTFANSTVAGNATDMRGAGIYVRAGAYVLLTNCTVTGNQSYSGDMAGGIYSHSNVQLKNTIVAANQNPWNSGERDIGGYIISGGHNLIGLVGSSSGYDSTDLLNVNPLLHPLGNYGGPTQTIALQSGSPAIDAGNNYLAPSTDQRGITRLLAGSTTDIGAYEYP